MALTDRSATLILLGIALLLAFVLFIPWTGETPDQKGYAMWLSSLLFDGDLEQTNDTLACSDLANQAMGAVLNVTATGHLKNPWSVGPAVLWAPALAPCVWLERLVIGADGWGTPDRFAWRYRVVISLVTLLLGCHSILLLYHILRRRFSPGASLAGAAIAVLGSPNLIYMYQWSAMSHTQALWAASVVLWLSQGLQIEGPRRPGWRDWALGMAVGVSALMRWSGVVWAAVPAAVYIAQMIRPRGPRWRPVAGAGLAALGSLFAFTPQMIAWRVVYGHWLLIPQGQDFVYSSERHLWLAGVLFSRMNGLFYAHPWLLLAGLGLALWIPRAGALGIGVGVVVIVEWLINASLIDWIGAVTFGPRRWCEVMPAFALGWAAIVSALPAGRPRRTIGGGITAFAIGMNVILALLWSRGIVGEDWWCQLAPVAWPVLGSIVMHPLEWIVSPLWMWVDGVPRFGWVPPLILGPLVALIGALALFTRRGSAPWPSGRSGVVSTALVAGYLSITCIALLWAGGRAQHTRQLIAARDYLYSLSPLVDWWSDFDEQFPLDADVPALLALSAEAAFRESREEEAWNRTERLASIFPRYAWLQVLHLSADPEQRATATLNLLAQSRWGDRSLEDWAIQEMVAQRRSEIGSALRRRPLSQPDQMELFLAALPRVSRFSSSETRHLERAARMRPHDSGISLRLSEIARGRGDSERANWWRDHVRRWTEARMSSYRHLAEINDPLFPWHLEAHILGSGHALISVLDPVTESGEIERTAQFLESHLRDPGAPEALDRHIFLHQWDWARCHPSPEVLEALSPQLEAHAYAHSTELESFMAIAEIRGLSGDWRGAFETIAAGSALHPLGTDWSQFARLATDQLTLDSLASCEIDLLPQELRADAALGLSARAKALGDHALAEEWSRVAQQMEADLREGRGRV